MKKLLNICAVSSAVIAFGIQSVSANDSHLPIAETIPLDEGHAVSYVGHIGEKNVNHHTASKIIEKNAIAFNAAKELLPDSPLRGLITSSLHNSDALQAVRHEAKAAHEGVNLAKFRLLPEVSFSADVGRTNARLTNLSPQVDRSIKTGSINLNWTVYSAGANFAAIKAAKYTALAADMDYLAQERRAIIESLGVYLQLLGSQKLVASLSGTKARMNKILRSTRHQYKAGFASRTDVAQVKSEIASIQSQLEQANQTLEQNKIAWRSRSGNKASGKLALPKIAALIPKSKKLALHKALNGNPIIAASNYTAKAANQNSEATKAQFLPNISLYGNLETNLESNPFSSDNRTWSAGVRLNVPLVNFAATSQYKQSQERAYAAHYRAQDTRRQVAQEVETNWASLASFKRQQTILSKKIGASRAIAKGIGKEVSAGLRPVNDLLRAEIELASNQIRHFQNDINKIASAYRIAIHFQDLSLSSFRL